MRLIGGFSNDELNAILSYNDKERTVREVGGSIIVMPDNKIIKCVGNYYCKNDVHNKINSFASKKSNSAVVNCQNTKKALNLTRGAVLECTACHRECRELMKKQVLKRK